MDYRPRWDDNLPITRNPWKAWIMIVGGAVYTCAGVVGGEPKFALFAGVPFLLEGTYIERRRRRLMRRDVRLLALSAQCSSSLAAVSMCESEQVSPVNGAEEWGGCV